MTRVQDDARPLTIVLASPRGFCAGVDRAIHVVERALEKWGAPVYVRHEIVHNQFVVDTLAAKGAVFVEELDEVPDGVPVVFSAHGVAKSVQGEADRRSLTYLDATCPLVTKVHREAELHYSMGRQIIMIGHSGHPEVEGTMGQVPEGAVILVENTAQAETVAPANPDNLAYITQTTLSVEDAGAVVEVLRRRFPDIVGPRREDICYATTNRQAAVRAIAPKCDAVMVIGSPKSSNSKRLVEVAARAGCPRALLVPRVDEFDWSLLEGIDRLGLTAGASAPELLVEEVVAEARRRFQVSIEEVKVTAETVAFKLPQSLVD
ncbi:MAG: 4-hydroxy-3-methylbut-2-enyl diphosphate reductase [Actinomycetota bacterium]